MSKGNDIVRFTSDYMEGACPEILTRLVATNMEQTAGYGMDEYSNSAKEKIRQLCQVPQAEIHFMVGGTQTNATVIGAALRSYQGVIAADTGHVSVHEAGAIEFGGHKVITVPHVNGKVTPEAAAKVIKAYQVDENRDHMVMPGMIYISQPTEFATLYSLAELEALSRLCRDNHIPLYMDGARLAYALVAPTNDVTLADIARLCDIFYIGGTKCGAFFGEAVVFPKPNYIPHFYTIMKQHGALLAKGRILGLQFDTLFTDNLYSGLGRKAVEFASEIRTVLEEKGYRMAVKSQTNQIFIIVDSEIDKKIAQVAKIDFWERIDDEHKIMRISTSWATNRDDVAKLIAIL